jgi:oxygen-independent coproporphyrinogen-3 oxidase
MDHFARPDDELAVAQRNKRLQRNFQGYSTHAGSDIYAFGMSSISQITDAYWQNEKELPKYRELLQSDQMPRSRAYLMSPEDMIRREVIMRVMCDLSLDYAAISQQLGLDVESHFASELAALESYASDGLILRTASGFTITDRGRLFIRNIAMCFDQTLVPTDTERHSKTV